MKNRSPENVPHWSRWQRILAESPSGKSLFVCLVCGSKTPAPTTECPRGDADRDRLSRVDHRIDLVLPVDVRTCSGIERHINGNIAKYILGTLLLDVAEQKLLHPRERECVNCHGYGCQECLGECVGRLS